MNLFGFIFIASQWHHPQPWPSGNEIECFCNTMLMTSKKEYLWRYSNDSVSNKQKKGSRPIYYEIWECYNLMTSTAFVFYGTIIWVYIDISCFGISTAVWNWHKSLWKSFRRIQNTNEKRFFNFHWRQTILFRVGPSGFNQIIFRRFA